MPMSARAQRLTRGWIVGLVATTVAAVSHSLAGGHEPGLLSFGTALVFAGTLGTFVIGRRPSLPRLSVAVGVSQLAFHLLFSLLGNGGGAPAAGTRGMAGMTGMGMDDSPVTAPLATGAHDHFADPGMWMAHAVAAALTVLFLRRAELAVWTMLSRLGRLVVTRLTAPPTSTPLPSSGLRRLPARPAIERAPVERILVASASRRGPPLFAF